jgi:nucleoid-associated protein YgaU
MHLCRRKGRRALTRPAGGPKLGSPAVGTPPRKGEFPAPFDPIPQPRMTPMQPDEPDFSDVSGGSSSTAGAKGGRTYTIAKGDTLGKIAKQFYGDAKQWRKLADANKDTIKNPDLIYPGQVIKIPDA